MTEKFNIKLKEKKLQRRKNYKEKKIICCAFGSTFESQSCQNMLQFVHMGCSPWFQMLSSIMDSLFVAVSSYQLDELLQP